MTPTDGEQPDAHAGRSDEALMAAYAAGDAGAFELLFQRHRQPLFTYLLHHGGSRELAEDLFQEVFVKLIRARTTYAPTGGFRAWLYVIARHALTDQHRRSSVRKVVTTESSLGREGEGAAVQGLEGAGGRDADRAADPVVQTGNNALRERIEAALLELPGAQREVFLLRERAGLDYAAIAQVTGCPVATAKSRMRYALGGLRRLLAGELAAVLEPSHD